jgi:hypothetical protein
VEVSSLETIKKEQDTAIDEINRENNHDEEIADLTN